MLLALSSVFRLTNTTTKRSTMSSTRFAVSLVLFLIICFNNVLQISSTVTQKLNDTLRNMLILSDGTILVGSTSRIYKLGSSLAEEMSIAISERNRLLLQINDTGLSADILSCQENGCFLLDSQDLSNTTVVSPTPTSVLFPGTDDIPGVFVGNRQLFVARDNFQSIVSSLSKLSYTEVSSGTSLPLSIDGKQRETLQFISRLFLTSFQYHGFVYYVFVVTHHGMDLQVARICTNDTGASDSNIRVLTTYTEAELQCSQIVNINDVAATFVEYNGEPLILVSVNNVICSFNVSYIDERMDNKLDNCKNANGLLNLVRDSQGSRTACPSGFSEEQKNLITPCNRLGDLILTMEVDSPTEGFQITSFSSSFNSLNTLKYENTVYVFAGRSGAIEQFYFTAQNSLQHIRTIKIDDTSSVDEIHFSHDSESLFAITSSSVIKHPINVCNQLKTCDTCIQSLDPICGWCTLSSSCTKLNECTTTPQIWQTSSDRCPHINTVIPSVVYVDQLVIPLPELTMNVSNIPGIPYMCLYQFGSVTTMSNAVVDTDNVTVNCSLPSSTDLPIFTEDTFQATLTLQTSNGINVVSTIQQQLAFTNCSIRTSCSSCLSTQQTCNWCPLESKCVSPLQTCVNSLNGTAYDNCPLIQPPDRTDTTDYLVHVNISQSLVIKARNLHIFNTNDIFCVLKDKSGNILYQLNATWNETSVVCSETNFNISLDSNTSIYESTLEIQVSNGISIENINNSKVIFYSCPLMGENCGQCLGTESQFRCGYCLQGLQANSCIPFMLSSQCSDPLLIGINDVNKCETPVITQFSPTAGTISGGTTITITGENLGASADQVAKIEIQKEVCMHLEEQYIPGTRVVCKTKSTSTGIVISNIVITFTYNTNVSSNGSYSFLIPRFKNPPAEPNLGPLSGGTRVTIQAENIGIGNNRSISLAGKQCDIQNEQNITVYSENITCITSASDTVTTRGQGAIVLNIDGTMYADSSFDYENDPVFMSIRPKFFFQSGGTKFKIFGEFFNTIQYPQLIIYINYSPSRSKRATNNSLIIYSDECTKDRADLMTCEAPSLDALEINESTTIQLGLKMDNVLTLRLLENITLDVHKNPLFSNTQQIQLNPGDKTNITLNGNGFFFINTQITVMVGPLTCAVGNITETTLTCQIDIPDDISERQMYTINIKLGNFETEAGAIEIRPPINLLFYLVPSFIALIILFVVIFIVVISVFYHKYKQKDEQNDRLLFELEKLESSVAHECKLGFAELQTDLDELTGDLTGIRLPYHDLPTYLLQSLFPGAKDHPTLHEPQLPSLNKARIESGIKQFHRLLLDKTVLLNIIHSLESQKQFNIRDKSNVGSLLMIALHDRLDYATLILKRLLSDLVRRTVAESLPKLLLRRTESVAEKMLSSWLAFTLHDYVVEHTGQPLYLLYKAVKAQLEKGPIDVITGEARYSLSEQKLIRQQLEIQFINATVETEDGLQIPVKLIDCDSVSQAKEKMLDAVFKNAPVSQRPPLTTIDIEYRKSPKECLILRDEDGTNVTEYGWRRINTLRHYWVTDKAIFRLVPRGGSAGPGKVMDYTGSLMVSHGHRTRTLSDGEDGARIWHLFKQVDEDPRSSPFMSKKMVTEIYLPRMLSTKTILQQFVDDLFNSVFTLSHPPISPSHLYTPIATAFPHTSGSQFSYAPGSDSLPIAIKYLFDMLDDEAMGAKITDPDVVHTWKNNSLALRFWVNLIKNPEFVFDINKSAIVDSCLSVIAQAFIDGCSSSEAKPTINSPTSKLLYNKEVQGYKNNVKFYYEEIQELQKVPEEIMMQYLKDLSAHQAELFRKSQHQFNINSAVYEILRYAIKYRETILQGLRASGLESKAQIFESVLHCTM